jgi:hypothetical protein
MAKGTYKGNCHCGANRFELQFSEIEIATRCNCSLCAKKGYLWITPANDEFKFTRGSAETTTSYASASLDHLVCFRF